MTLKVTMTQIILNAFDKRNLKYLQLFQTNGNNKSYQ